MSSKILIIDDDDVVHYMHEALLKISGTNTPVLSFSNGKDALHYIENDCTSDNNYLLFLDINMPELNGWQLLSELDKKGLNCSFYVIILTSSVDSEDHLSAKGYNSVVDFIEKPLTQKHLQLLKRKYPHLLD